MDRDDSFDVFDYDTTAGLLITAARFSNTVIPTVIRRSGFWFFLCVHLILTYLFRSGYIAEAREDGESLHVRWTFIQVAAPLTTFFQVFYTNECYNRYLHLYRLTRGEMKRMTHFVFSLRVHLEGCGKQHMRLATRYVLASLLIFCNQISSIDGIVPHPTVQGIDSEEDCFLKGTGEKLPWHEYMAHRLIMQNEREFLNGYNLKVKHLILMQWTGEVTRRGVELSGAPANVLTSLTECLCDAMEAQQDVLDTFALPVPFQYFHLLSLMVVVNLSLWAYAMAMTQSIHAPVIYVLLEIIFMGMMELASQLQNPFGSDAVDFPVTRWLQEHIQETVTFVEFDSSEFVNLEKSIENEPPLSSTLSREMSPIGTHLMIHAM